MKFRWQELTAAKTGDADPPPRIVQRPGLRDSNVRNDPVRHHALVIARCVDGEDIAPPRSRRDVGCFKITVREHGRQRLSPSSVKARYHCTARMVNQLLQPREPSGFEDARDLVPER